MESLNRTLINYTYQEAPEAIKDQSSMIKFQASRELITEMDHS